MRSYKHIVIVGAGPIGLYMAIQLKRRGIQDITVIDPRAGAYTRPGILDKNIFEFVENQLNTSIKYSRSRHIKDLERALYELATKIGIRIEQAKFVGLEAQRVIIEPAQNKTLEELTCDIVFDASGSARAVIHAINTRAIKMGETTPLEIEPVTHVDVVNHFIAYVQMDDSHTETLQGRNKTPHDSVHALLALEKIHDQFDWPSASEPDFHYQKLSKNKICLYFEAPSDLQGEEAVRWVNLMLQVKTGKEDVDFTQREASKNPNKKPSFKSFTVNPSIVKQHVYESTDLPLVIPIGDAQIEPDYRIGFGVKSGVNRANTFLDAITSATPAGFEFNQAQYQHFLGVFIKMHIQELEVLYRNRKEKLFSAESYEKTLKRYKDALGKANPQEQTVLTQRIHALETATIQKYNERAKIGFGKKYYTQAQDHYKKIITLCENDLNKSHETDHVKAYSNLVVTLKMAGKTDEAIAMCERAFSLFEENNDNAFFFRKLRLNHKKMQETHAQNSSKPSKKQ